MAERHMNPPKGTVDSHSITRMQEEIVALKKAIDAINKRLDEKTQTELSADELQRFGGIPDAEVQAEFERVAKIGAELAQHRERCHLSNRPVLPDTEALLKAEREKVAKLEAMIPPRPEEFVWPEGYHCNKKVDNAGRVIEYAIHAGNDLIALLHLSMDLVGWFVWFAEKNPQKIRQFCALLNYWHFFGQ